MAPRQPFRGEDSFPRRRDGLVDKKTSKSRHENSVRKKTDLSSSSTSSSRDVQSGEFGTSPKRHKTRNVSFASAKRRQSWAGAPINEGEEMIASEAKPTTGNASSVSSGRIPRNTPKDETFASDSRERGKVQMEKPLSESSDEVQSDESENDGSPRILNQSGSHGTSGAPRRRKSIRRHPSDGIRSYKPEVESRHKTSSERRKRLASGNERRNSLRSRRTSRGDQNGRGVVHELAQVSTRSKRDELPREVVKHMSNRIVLPSRMSTRCQGIRHAFGLSSAYCDCERTGSGVRRVRLKKISRGVQCDPPKSTKCMKSCGLGGYFGFGCCRKKSRRSRGRNSGSPVAKVNSTGSSEIYAPKIKEQTKEPRAIARSHFEQSRGKREAKSKRIGGGAEEINFQRLERVEVFPGKGKDLSDKHFYGQRHRRGTRREREPPSEQLRKNGVADVKRRLNKCLVELNGIIGDVGIVF